MEARRKRKEEKKERERMENDLRVARIVDMQLSHRWGSLRQQQEISSKKDRSRRKKKLQRKLRRREEPSEPEFDEEVEALRADTERMELCPNSSSTNDDNCAAPAITPLTRTARKMYSTSRGRGRPRKMLPLKPYNIASEIVPEAGPDARARSIRNAKEQLKTLDYKEVKDLCKREQVPYIRKQQAIANLVEHRAPRAFGRDRMAPPATHPPPLPVITESSSEAASSSDVFDEGSGSDEWSNWPVERLWGICRGLIRERKKQVGVNCKLEASLRWVVFALPKRGGIRWGHKFLNDWTSWCLDHDDGFNSASCCVYVAISPFCKAVYIGKTERNLDTRWGEHLRKCGQGGPGNHFRRWLSSYGKENYVLLSLIGAPVHELLAVENFYIRHWCPILNTVGRKCSNSPRRRRGKRERRKCPVDKQETCAEVRIISFCVNNGKGSMQLNNLLIEQDRNQIRNFTLASSGGTSWYDGWKRVKRLFG
ncbi:hypothetical protein CBR_g48746 [Chara braunii]|uniref:GIY-YIG domain-containing protein n=1 Tax=Chara braunii TaxID=69332 RepID=A0A388K4N0_CHABU|nr:hypothetical protein CBR_g48746 [Chara braunii]|eukprot:GBG64997.1 hypothetical protein CBR_g48746 [Chara braunii]